MKLSVVIPAHNEEDVIGTMVHMLLAVYDKEILQCIVVDDSSSDTTPKIVRALAKKDKRIKLIRRKPPNGVGRAIREGLKHVDKKATHILTMDADFIRNIPDLTEFFDRIDSCDGLIGSRYKIQHSLVRYPWVKKVFNRSYHVIARLIYGVKQADLTNNFKFYKKEVFDALPLTAHDYAINAETGLYPILLGYNIGEVPITWYARQRGEGESKFELFNVAQYTSSYFSVLVKAMDIKSTPWSPLLHLFNTLLKLL